MQDPVSADRYQITAPLSESMAWELVNFKKLESIQGDIHGNTNVLNNIIFKNRKDITLRLFKDISILKQLPEVEKVQFVVDFSQDFHVLNSLKKITALFINGDVRGIKKSLTFLTEYSSSLTQLGLEGDFKDIETIAELKNLQRVSLHSTSAKNLDFIARLPLISFFNYGSKVKDYQGLGEVRCLEKLFIKKDTRVSSLDFIASLKQFKKIYLHYNSNIHSLPNLEQMNSLEILEVFQCNKLEDINSAIKLGERCAVKIWGCKLLPRPNLGYFNQKGLEIGSTLW